MFEQVRGLIVDLERVVVIEQVRRSTSPDDCITTEYNRGCGAQLLSHGFDQARSACGVQLQRRGPDQRRCQCAFDAPGRRHHAGAHRRTPRHGPARASGAPASPAGVSGKRPESARPRRSRTLPALVCEAGRAWAAADAGLTRLALGSGTGVGPGVVGCRGNRRGSGRTNRRLLASRISGAADTAEGLGLHGRGTDRQPPPADLRADVSAGQRLFLLRGWRRSVNRRISERRHGGRSGRPPQAATGGQHMNGQTVNRSAVWLRDPGARAPGVTDCGRRCAAGGARGSAIPRPGGRRGRSRRQRAVFE
jgi:hypothetical protein